MRPPSRCCTRRRLPSGLTTPGATAAPDRGAVAAHPPPTTKKPSSIAAPRSAGPRNSRRSDRIGAERRASGPVVATSGTGRAICGSRASFRFLLLAASALRSRHADLRPRRRLDDARSDFRRAPGGDQLGEDLVAGTEHLASAVTQQQQLVHRLENSGLMGDENDRGAPTFGLRDRLDQALLAVGVEAGVGLVENEEPRLTVQRAPGRGADAGRRTGKERRLGSRSRSRAAGAE